MATQVTSKILEDGAHNDRGLMAKIQYFVGAIAIGDIVKSTLGPYGADKILLPVGTEGASKAKATVTNDGATILSKIWIDNPAAQILVNLSRTQDATVGDGTTGVVVLAAELLREAEQLCLKRIHPQIITKGYNKALEIALNHMQGLAIKADDDTLKSMMTKLAKTTLSSKIVQNVSDHFADIAVDAISRLKGDMNLDLLNIQKVPGATMKDSYVAPGFLLEKELPASSPNEIVNAKILLADTPMDADKIKIFGAKVRTDSYAALQQISDAESAKMTAKINLIKETGCTVFINRQLIYDEPMELFQKSNITAIEHADFNGIESLQKVLDCDITAFYTKNDKVRLGKCDKISKVSIGDKNFLMFEGCAKDNACSIVLRGSNEHVLDETERSLHDALAVMSQTAIDGRFVYGGGAIEMAIATAIEREARFVEGKVSTVMKAFARAFRVIPTIVLDNAGYDTADMIAKLESVHHSGLSNMGVDVHNGGIADMGLSGVVESYWSKSHQIRNAVESAVMLIRCDEVIRCAPRQRRGV